MFRRSSIASPPALLARLKALLFLIGLPQHTPVVAIACMRITALCYFLLRAMADDEETHFEIRRVQYGRMPLGPDQLFFKPCLIYQRLLDEHVVDAGLELRVDMTTGLKEARYNAGVNISDDSDRAQSILDRQLKCIDDNDEHAFLGDGPTVARRLAAAASWGDASLTTHILRTCYVTVGQASEVLYAVAGQGGAPEVVDVLLRAGAELRPFDGRTALHAALGNGHEEVATALVAAASPDIVSTALQLARANDFGPIARRIEARLR